MPETDTKKPFIFKHPVLIVSIVVLACIVVLISQINRTVSNTEGVAGNTTLNLYNGGLFCEGNDGLIYFSNLSDGGALYSMDESLSDFKHMCDDTVGYINNTTGYIVYSRLNYTRNDSNDVFFQFSDSGLYRLSKKNRKNLESLYILQVGLVGLLGNDIYYQRYEKGTNAKLYHATLNLKKNELCLDEAIMPGTNTGKGIIYAGTGKTHYIYMLDPSTGKSSTIYKGNCAFPALVGDHIYFQSLTKDYALARIDKDGGNPTILNDERCSSYNVSNDEQYMIYQVDDNKDNRLVLMNLSTQAKTIIAYGNYNCIHIVGNRVFFREFDSDNEYYFSLDNPLNVEKFVAPDLTEGNDNGGSNATEGGIESGS